MAILSFPTGLRNPSSMRFGLLANTQSGGKSPFDGTEQTLQLPGARWAAELRWDRLVDAEWRIMQAFIASLGGRAGRFTWGPPHMPRKGDATSDGSAGPRVLTGGQTGKIINVTGFDGGQYAFRQGDILGWTGPDSRPVIQMVTADVAAADPTSTNLQIQSGAPTNAAFLLGSAITDGGAVADPLGGGAARRLLSSATAGSYIVRAARLTVLPSTPYTLSMYARKNAGTITTGNLLVAEEFDAAPAFTLRTLGPAMSGLTSAWARYSRTFTTGATTTSVQLPWAYAWNAGGEVDVWGFQVEQRSTMTGYIPTTTAPGTRTQSLAVPIAPGIRRSPNAGALLTLSVPPAVWRLTEDDAGMEYERGVFAAVTLKIEEAIF